MAINREMIATSDNGQICDNPFNCSFVEEIYIIVWERWAAVCCIHAWALLQVVV